MSRFFRLIVCSLLLLISGLLAGCGSAASAFDQSATGLGLVPQSVAGKDFVHTVYESSTLMGTSRENLHIYLDGDGTPWFDNRYVTDDPTPLKSTVLRLVKQDKGPAIYLGRPCYHQAQQMPTNCTQDLWTSARYSPQVVASMVSALNHYLANKPYKRVTLIGFSGGGTLAMLMAPHLPQVTAVITLAGNLDTDAWAQRHGYRPLTGSLNPARQPPLSAAIRQIHIIGADDRNIFPELTKSVLAHQANARLIILPEVDHHCCWEKYLPQILSDADS